MNLELRSVPCDDEGCPTVLAGPAHPGLCQDCREQFEQQGIPTHDEQLELPVEVEIGAKTFGTEIGEEAA